MLPQDEKEGKNIKKRNEIKSRKRIKFRIPMFSKSLKNCRLIAISGRFRGPSPSSPSRKNFRLSPVKINEKLIHTTSNEPQKVIFAHNRCANILNIHYSHYYVDIVCYIRQRITFLIWRIVRLCLVQRVARLLLSTSVYYHQHLYIYDPLYVLFLAHSIESFPFILEQNFGQCQIHLVN